MIRDATVTDVEEETEDIDWFAVDRAGSIAHFASGGRGFIPASVKASRNDVITLQAFFRGLHAPVSVSVESQHATPGRYFLEMASKGLYSFDCIVEPTRPSGYYLVAAPHEPLNVSLLPTHIQSILNRTVIYTQLSSCREVSFAAAITP